MRLLKFLRAAFLGPGGPGKIQLTSVIYEDTYTFLSVSLLYEI